MLGGVQNKYFTFLEGFLSQHAHHAIFNKKLLEQKINNSDSFTRREKKHR